MKPSSGRAWPNGWADWPRRARRDASMSAHPFDAAIALAPQGEGIWHGHTSPPYANMVGPFGGATAAQALSGVLQHPQRLGEPVAFTVNFAAALSDGPFE